MQKEIIDFIEKFKFKHREELEYVFLNGNCYFFALILCERFKNAKVKLMQIENHFVTEIEGRLYDIRGDVTEICSVPDLIDFDDLEKSDPTYYKRLKRDCFYKV